MLSIGGFLGKNLTHNMGAFSDKKIMLSMGAFLGENVT